MNTIDFSAPPTIIRGGTYYICKHQTLTEVKTPKLDKNGRKTRYFTTTTIPGICGRRFRMTFGPSRILRHVRRAHGVT